MLTFLEGMPRAGKSYDCVRSHILPALKNGRTVYAHLNGLNHERIAKHLDKPLDEIQQNLQLISGQFIRENIKANIDEELNWSIPEEHTNALFVFDECHEFWPSRSEHITPATVEWFARHGHNGIDAILISQFYKALDTRIRYRVERKVTYSKLTAIGASNRVNITHWQATSPDKYEKAHRESHKLDSKIFPLYKGFTEDAETEVYQDGKNSIWRKLLPMSFAVVVLAGFGGYKYLSALGGGSSLLNKQSSQHVQQTKQENTTVKQTNYSQPKTTQQQINKEPPPKLYPPAIQYIIDTSNKARPRLAGYFIKDGKLTGIVEFVSDSDFVYDTLRFSDIEKLGFKIDLISERMVSFTHDDKTIFATQWPREKLHGFSQSSLVQQQQMAQQRPLPSRVNDPPLGQASEASLANGGSSQAINMPPDPIRKEVIAIRNLYRSR